MALVKRRPKIRLKVPQVLLPGRDFTAEVILEAKREVPCGRLTAALLGTETLCSSRSQQSRHYKNWNLVSLGADLATEVTLPAGRSVYAVRFDVPPNAPPSLAGRLVRVRYWMEVRAEIPWWPDARSSFELIVGPRAEAPDADAARVYSTAPQGPKSDEPFLEVSFASPVVAPGGVLVGSLALGNAAFNRYGRIDFEFMGSEVSRAGHRQLSEVSWRMPAGSRPLLNPGDAPLPFDLAVPEALPCSAATARWDLNWHLAITARVAGRRDVQLWAPIVVVPRYAERPPRSGFRAVDAPPSVGSERLRNLWSSVGAPFGLVLDEDGVLRGERAGAEAEVRRDHRGRDGIFVVAELRFPALHLGLLIEPVGRIAGLLRRGIEVGDAQWERRHRVSGRSRAQIQALLGGPLVEALKRLGATRVDDRSARTEIRDAGQSSRKLAALLEAVALLAEALGAARRRIPPPPLMAGALPAWEALAVRLGGPLETARMAAAGRYEGLAAEVRTEWADEDHPLHTAVEIRPEPPLSAEFALRLSDPSPALVALLSGSGEPEGSVAGGEVLHRFPPAAIAALGRLLEGAAGIEVAPESLTLLLPAAFLDPAPALERLRLLWQLAMALRGAAGPYR